MRLNTVLTLFFKDLPWKAVLRIFTNHNQTNAWWKFHLKPLSCCRLARHQPLRDGHPARAPPVLQGEAAQPHRRRGGVRHPQVQHLIVLTLCWISVLFSIIPIINSFWTFRCHRICKTFCFDLMNWKLVLSYSKLSSCVKVVCDVIMWCTFFVSRGDANIANTATTQIADKMMNYTSPTRSH